MKQPISILLAGILAIGLSACGPKAETTAVTTPVDSSATATTSTTGQPVAVTPDGTAATAMGTDASTMGSTGAAGTTASGSADTATSAMPHAKAPGTNESHPRAEAVNRANGDRKSVV